MLRVIRICRKCGARIFADAPEGLCPRCVLKTALAMPSKLVAGGDSSAEASPKADGPDQFDKPERATKSERVAEMLGELGDYELLEEVGRGGQGVVFRARQKSLNRIVALKVISLGQWASKVHLRRFRLEAEAAARLEHPGIVPIHEVGERDGSCYFSMKFVEGGQLDEVARREPMPPRRGAELIAKVARTVHYAHEHGILHRDIKPGNILLDAKGEPHLTDFGLARLVESESSVTQTLDVLGTPSYMAPEQALGNNAAVSSATDVYGLGAVLYQLLTGQPPFAGGATYETIKLLLDTEPRQPRLLNPKIDRDLSTICLKCLEKDPKRRYTSALALAEDLERWLKHEPIQARHTGIFARGKKWVRRNPSSALLAASLIALAAAAGWIVWKSEFIRQPLATGIAVLPFENLSEQRENAAAFVDGVQDDILTKLARIADLKVISRSSVMEYREKRNVRQIGNDLRVSHLLEGSVRRIGTRFHMNAQLIDTHTDTHVWVEQYDGDFNDLFAIQSEIAQKIAERNRELEEAGFGVQVQDVPGLSLVFSTSSGARRRVPIKATAKQTVTEDMGPNVLLRPIVERAILPTATYIGGPAEIAYFAQISPIADVLGVPRPSIVPRWSCTIIEPHVEKILEKLYLLPEDLRDPHEPENRIARDHLPKEVLEELDATRGLLDERIDALAEAVTAGEAPIAPAVTGGLRANLMRRLERFERRLVGASKRRHADLMQEIGTARGSLYPFGKPQERALNFVPFLARYGKPLRDEMLDGAHDHAASIVGASRMAERSEEPIPARGPA